MFYDESTASAADSGGSWIREKSVCSEPAHLRAGGAADRAVEVRSVEVLIASDFKHSRRLLGRAFRRHGYRVDYFGINHRLLGVVKHSGHPDRADSVSQVLVLDTRDKPWVGLSLLEVIRSHDWTTKIVVLHKVSADREMARRADELGANAVISLPCDIPCGEPGSAPPTLPCGLPCTLDIIVAAVRRVCPREVVAR